MILIVRVPVKPKNSKVSNIDRTKKSRLNRKIEPRLLKALAHKAFRRFTSENPAIFRIRGISDAASPGFSSRRSPPAVFFMPPDLI